MHDTHGNGHSLFFAAIVAVTAFACTTAAHAVEVSSTHA